MAPLRGPYGSTASVAKAAADVAQAPMLKSDPTAAAEGSQRGISLDELAKHKTKESTVNSYLKI